MDLCLIRTFTGFCVAIFASVKSGKHLIKDLPQDKWAPLLLRSFMGLLGFVCLLFSLKYLQISIVTIILNMAPFWSSILSYFFTGYRVSLIEGFCMCGSFVGVTLIALAKDAPSDSEDKLISSTSSDKLKGLAFILVTSWTYPIVVMTTRKMKDVHYSLV